MIEIQEKHQAELEERGEEDVVLRVFTTSGVLLSEFFLKKLPTDDAASVAQAAYNQIYGSQQ